MLKVPASTRNSNEHGSKSRQNPCQPGSTTREYQTLHYTVGTTRLPIYLRDLWRAWRIRETVEVRDVRRNGGGRGLCGGPGKRVDGVFPGRHQSFRHQRRPVDDCSPGRGEMAQNGRTRGGTFYGKMDRCRKKQGWTTAYAVVCPNVTGRNEERITQSKRLVLVRSPLLTSHKWRELVPSGRLVCRCHDVFLWCYVCFCFASFSSLCFR